MTEGEIVRSMAGRYADVPSAKVFEAERSMQPEIGDLLEKSWHTPDFQHPLVERWEEAEATIGMIESLRYQIIWLLESRRLNVYGR